LCCTIWQWRTASINPRTSTFTAANGALMATFMALSVAQIRSVPEKAELFFNTETKLPQNQTILRRAEVP